MALLIEVAGPAVEPVTRADCYGQLNLPAEGDPLAHPKDAELDRYIATSRRIVEATTGFALVEKTLELRLDCRFPAGAIWLPVARLRSVEAVVYTDATGAEQTLAPAAYDVFGVGADSGGRICPAYGTSWPATRDRPEAVVVTFKAGFGTAATDVPVEIRQAILLHVEALFDVAVNETGASPEMPAAGWRALSHWLDRRPRGLA